MFWGVITYDIWTLCVSLLSDFIQFLSPVLTNINMDTAQANNKQLKQPRDAFQGHQATKIHKGIKIIT